MTKKETVPADSTTLLEISFLSYSDMASTSTITLETSHAAHTLVDLGYHLVPIGYGSKRPLISWKRAESSHENINDWFEHFGPTLNIAIHVGRSGIIVLDADSDEAAKWIAEQCPLSPMTALTPRDGRHAYFQAAADVPAPQQNLFGIQLDIKSRTSLVVAAPSWSREHRRRWAWEQEILPVLPSSLIHPEPITEHQATCSSHVLRQSKGPIRDVTKWIMEVESIQGSGGSNQCFKVACRLADAGFSWEEAMSWLRLWNSRKAVPPWSEKELIHKLRDAFER